MDAIDLETANLEEIEGLNQRGGRTLSFIDLIEAGTVSAELAGELAALVEAGASVMTAAKPGGVGKSTVLANLLACLPPGERIVTVANHAEALALASRAERPCCALAHEIGPGPYYSYLWAKAAAAFLELPSRGFRIATCIHADELDELYEILRSQGSKPEAINKIGVIVFVRQLGSRRRVDSVYVSAPGGHRVRWLWEESSDAFLPQGQSPVEQSRAERLAGIFEELSQKGIRELTEVRRALAKELARR